MQATFEGLFERHRRAIRAMKLDVLWVDGDRFADVTTFGTPAFPWFGPPEML